MPPAAAWAGSASREGSGRSFAQITACPASVLRLSSDSRSPAGALTMSSPRAQSAAVRALTAVSRATRQLSDGLHHSRTVFGDHGRFASQDAASSALGVDRVGLATLFPEPLVRAVHVNDFEAPLSKVAAQAGAIGAGRLHPDSSQLPVGAHPLDELSVPAAVGSELPVSEALALFGEHEGVVRLLVTVHAADDYSPIIGHDVGVLPARDDDRVGRTKQ